MLTENLSSQQAETGSASTNSIKQQVLDSWQSSSDYRHAFIEEAIRSRLTAQINALRNEEGWDYKTFAEKLGKKLSWAYRLEDPNSSVPTIPTLLAVAEAFDIGLDVRFRRFSELLDDTTTLAQGSFLVPSFASELRAGAFGRTRRKGSHKGLILMRRKRVRPPGKFDPAMASGATQQSIGSDYGIKKTG
jgi:transcriptional regulator with XRE-family HTH domain